MKKLILVMCCILNGINLHAQILTPVKWSYGSKKTSANQAIIFIKATIDDGWHIYSLNQKDGGPVKTTITFYLTKQYSLLGKTIEPSPTTIHDKVFQLDVSYFEKSVIFRQKIRLNAKQIKVKGKLSFMVCNDKKCLPPEDVNFSIPVK